MYRSREAWRWISERNLRSKGTLPRRRGMRKRYTILKNTSPCKNSNQTKFSNLILMFIFILELCQIRFIYHILLLSKFSMIVIYSKSNARNFKYAECTVQGASGDGSQRGTCGIEELCHSDGVCIRGML